MLKQEFSDRLQISMNIKDITIPLIIHYYLLRAFRTLHDATLNHNVRFLPCQHRGVGASIRVRAKPCVHRFNYSRTLRRVPRQGHGHWINPGIRDDSSHLTRRKY